MKPDEKRAAFVVGMILVSVNLASFIIAIAYKVANPIIGVLVLDLIFGGLAALMYIAHRIWPDSTHDDPEATMEIKFHHSERSSS